MGRRLLSFHPSLDVLTLLLKFLQEKTFVCISLEWMLINMKIWKSQSAKKRERERQQYRLKLERKIINKDAIWLNSKYRKSFLTALEALWGINSFIFAREARYWSCAMRFFLFWNNKKFLQGVGRCFMIY